jgi:DNA-binding response OmpR family regulator
MTSGAKKVLVVEDDRYIRDSVADVLESAGYHVQRAENGKVALEFLEKAPVDVILLDLGMPVMDGFAFRMEQERSEALARIPVVVMTANGDTENWRRLGAKGAIGKPFEIDEIVAAIQGAL